MPVKYLESLRQDLARADALLPLALVGIVSGAFSGCVIIAFRLIAESSFLTFGIRDIAEDFEALTWPWRIGLPVVGGLAIGIMMTSVSAGTRPVGVVHVTVRTNTTLREALDTMDRNDADVAVITGSARRDADSVLGILTRAQIDAAVRYGG